MTTSDWLLLIAILIGLDNQYQVWRLRARLDDLDDIEEAS